MPTLEKPIPVTVITGFLGSGKTTLLSGLLKNEEMKNTAVIINEFGEVGLDHALIECSDENIVEMQNGCICCTIRGDLHKTLIDLFDKMTKGQVKPFDRVVIETTGLADPVPIIHTLMSSFDLHRVYTLDGVITVVDAANGEDTLNTQQESVKQVAMAERIILSKTDIAKKATQESLIKRLEALNPAVIIIPGMGGNVSISDVFDLGTYDPNNKSRDVKAWLAAEKYEDTHDHSHHHHPHGQDHHHYHKHDVSRHGDNIQSFAMTSDKPVNSHAYNFFLHLLAGSMGADLLRVKGIINVAGEDSPAVVHGVQHIFHPVQWLDRWPDEDTRTRLVFIVRNIEKESIQALFDALMGVKDPDATPKEVAKAWMQAS